MKPYSISNLVTIFKVQYLKCFKKSAFIENNKLNLKILDLLLHAGYINGYKFVKMKKNKNIFYSIEIFFKYFNELPVFYEINEFSTILVPTRLSFFKIKERFPLNWFVVISTPSGLITNRDFFINSNNQIKQGGQLLFYIF